MSDDTEIAQELAAIRRDFPFFSAVIVRDSHVAACGDAYVHDHFAISGVPVIQLACISGDEICFPIVDPSMVKRRWKPQTGSTQLNHG